MRLALLVALGLSSAGYAQQPQQPADVGPPPIDHSMPSSGTSRSTDHTAKPAAKDRSLDQGSTGSSAAPLGPNDPKAPAMLNGKDSERMPNPKIEPGDSKPDR
ncbi:MAG: hypothetical protein JWM77_800 [Rhodospirillales bacterium]|jgi:hypothetical protein|nr:hypothetical protein [Rhodospirillales bacterium]